jgi:hypothetical protein
LALTPERRKEIAQQAALKRWGSSAQTKKAAPVKRLKGIAAFRQLTVTATRLTDGSGRTAMTVLEAGTLLRSFTGSAASVEDRVQGYLAALQDLGIELDVTHTSIPEGCSPEA